MGGGLANSLVALAMASPMAFAAEWRRTQLLPSALGSKLGACRPVPGGRTPVAGIQASEEVPMPLA